MTSSLSSNSSASPIKAGRPKTPTVAKPVDALTARELDAHVEAVRARLAGTLDALEEKANVPKQFKKRADKRAEQLRELRREKPAVFAAVVVGGLALSVGIIALVVKSATKR